MTRGLVTEELLNSLKERVKNFPKEPGVYLMKNVGEKIIYVGKAKSLRPRVRSYFAGGDGRHSLKYLVPRITEIETVVTQDG